MGKKSKTANQVDLFIWHPKVMSLVAFFPYSQVPNKPLGWIFYVNFFNKYTLINKWGRGKKSYNDITLGCQINESTWLTFLDFFPTLLNSTFSTLLIYLHPRVWKSINQWFTLELPSFLAMLLPKCKNWNNYMDALDLGKRIKHDFNIPYFLI